jgi:hypothetical protein
MTRMVYSFLKEDMKCDECGWLLMRKNESVDVPYKREGRKY